MHTIVLEGSCFKLRSWLNGDEVTMLYYANNLKVAAYVGNRFPSPYTATDARLWINLQLQQQEPVTNLALVIEGEVAGGIGMELQKDIYCKNAKIGYWLGEPFWGKGIMTEAVALFTNYIFNHFDVIRIHASVFGSNQASAKVLHKAGYQQEGNFKNALFKNGNYDDELVFAKTRPES